MRKLLGAVLAAVAGVGLAAGPAQATGTGAQACDLHIAKGVYSSAGMLYVAVSLDGCSTSVTEVLVELHRSDSAGGPFSKFDEAYAYSGGAAWFGPGTDCGYWKGVARWQGQTETTPDVNFGCS
ncbi:hypothetical protein HPO96_04240 [Kribbella sandramycini]|uniref:Spore-associated protein A n=1 Tax=Kribbella sandramycini TaxID=60450 RepID=A0A7Y4KVF8_9ACTN|nr:hypothetical protein [Kribbella sandramycini]MBB6567955.1 hypothetical protein [Kribbella sandramycini]NOL39450.1 hypothetical protein [Kribbella sandramycini]